MLGLLPDITGDRAADQTPDQCWGCDRTGLGEPHTAPFSSPKLFCVFQEKQKADLPFSSTTDTWERLRTEQPPPGMPQFPRREEQTLLCTKPSVLPASLERFVGFSPHLATHTRKTSHDLSPCDAMRKAPSPIT